VSPALLLWLAALFTLSPLLWKTHRTIRFESLLALWTVTAMALAWNPRNRVRGPLAGAAAGLALLTHPAGALAVAGTAAVLCLRRTSLRSAIRDLALALATVLVLALPTLFYFLEDRGSGFANVLGQNLPHLRGQPESLLARIAAEPHRYAAFFAWPRLLVPLASWILTLVLAWRARAPRALFAVVFLFAVGLALLPNKTELYLTLLAPFLYLLAAWVGANRPRRWVVGWGLLWVLVLAGADGALLRRNRECRYEVWAQPLAAPVPAGASVAGTFVTWFVFRDHPYLEIHRQRAGDLYDARPAYLVWGGRHMQDPIFERLRTELGPFLAEHADPVASTTSSCYGDAVLYRPRWDEADPEVAKRWERYAQEMQGER